MWKQITLVGLGTLALAASSRAQITVRDTIIALPPVSFCMDGATHVTECTNHRLRPQGFNLYQFVGQPLEITGNPGQITCSYVDVTAVRVLNVHQFTTTSTNPTALRVEFFGTGQSGDVFLLYAHHAVLSAGLPIPPLGGVLHLDPRGWIYLGAYTPLGAASPYASVNLPNLPFLRGVTLYDQALVVHQNLSAETSNVDSFQF